MVLVYQDGRGAGFGAFSLDRMFREQNRSYDTRESYRKLGVPFDQRDYECVFQILKSHLPSMNIQMVMNSPNSLIEKNEYAQALHRSGHLLAYQPLATPRACGFRSPPTPKDFLAYR